MAEPDTGRAGGTTKVIEEPGWYPDPYFLGRERYWDGRAWTEQCRITETKEAQASAAPVVPKEPAPGASTNGSGGPAAAKTAAAGARTAAGSAAAAGAAAASPKADAKKDAPRPQPSAPPTPPPPPKRVVAAATAAAAAEGTKGRDPITATQPVAPSAPPPAADATAKQPALADMPPPDATARQPAVVPPPVVAAVPDATATQPAVAAPPTVSDTGTGIKETEPAASVPAPVAPSTAPTQDAPPKEQSGAGAVDAPPRKVGPVKVDPKPEAAAVALKDDRDPAARRRRRILLAAIAVVIVVAAAAAAVVLLRHKGGGSNGTAVGSAATATMHLHTAAVAFNVKPAGGQNPSSHDAVPGITGNGEVDFKSTSASVTVTVLGNIAPVQMVLEKQTLYLSPGALVGELVHGKSWISATADDLGTSRTAGLAEGPIVFEEMIGNPKGLLNQLKAPGVKETSFGASIYQGTPVHGYAVTLTQKEIDNRVAHLPAGFRSAASGIHATEDVYVTTNGLVRAIVVPATIQANGSSYTADVEVVYSSWGDPVQIAAPAPDTVVTWAKFKQVLTYITNLR